MRYQHPDLQQITTFLRGKKPGDSIQQLVLVRQTTNLAALYADFGMQVAKKTETQRWYRGYGSDQYVYYAQQGPKKFLGGTFEVESYQDLERYVSRSMRGQTNSKSLNPKSVHCFKPKIDSI
jgi:hypothetical protein